MSRQIYNLLMMVLGLAYVAGVVLGWSGLVESVKPITDKQPEALAGGIAFIVFLVGVLVQAVLADKLTSTGRDVEAVTTEQVRARKLRQAEMALANGEWGSALATFENMGMHARALEIAQKHRDRASEGRLNHALKRFDLARTCFVEVSDFEGAARMCILLKDSGKAREYYKKAAENPKPGTSQSEIAGYWDRAKERVRAADIYEAVADLHRAAECRELLGQLERAKKLYEKSETIEIYEQRRGKSGSTDSQRVQGIQKGRQADHLEIHGDWFGAAQLHREAAEFLRAGQLFEKIEEWERASLCFEKAGDKQRANELKAKAPPPPSEFIADDNDDHSLQGLTAPRPPKLAMPNAPGQGGRSGQAGMSSAANMTRRNVDPAQFQAPAPHFAGGIEPSVLPPGAAMPVTFVGVSERVQYVPVFVLTDSAPVAGTNQISQEQLAGLIKNGSMPEHVAAQLIASPPQDWDHAAAELQQKGDHLWAAEVYRQIGKIDEAENALRRAGRPREAALMAFGQGQRFKAIQIIKQALMQEFDEEMFYLLVSVLVREKEFREVLEIISERLGDHGATHDLIPVLYKVARLFDSAGAKREALAIYDEIVSAGAVSHELNRRLRELQADLNVAPDSPLIGLSGHLRLPKEAFEKGAEKGRGFSRDLIKLDEVKQEPEVASKGYMFPPPRLNPFQSADALKPEAHQIVFSGAAIPKSPEIEARNASPYQFAPPDSKMDEEGTMTMISAEPQIGVSPDFEVSLLGKPIVPPPPTELDESQVSVPPISQAPTKYTEDATDESDVSVAVKEASAPANDPFSASNRYHINRELARGGMGIVYEAEDKILGRPVALKVVSREDADEEDISQFLMEARAIARILHPNIVAIYDIGLMNLRHYIAMEMVAGTELGKQIREEQMLQLKDALRIFMEMGEGLSAAHEAGIIHRDIKPANILLNKKKQVKIVDFGLAKLGGNRVGDEENPAFRTAGTPGYMAPEQIRGSELQPSCDIYAMGMILFAMLVGKPPHKSAGISKVNEILHFTLKGQLPSIRKFRPDVPEAIDQIFQFCTMPRHEERYQSVDAFLPTVREWHSAI